MRGLGSLFAILSGMALTGLVHYASAASPADLCVVGAQATTTVASANALQSALSQAAPGTTIVVKEGHYSGDFTLSKSGNASKPITIRAGGQVTFKNSEFTLKGSYAVLTGMTFDNGMVTIQGNYNRVTRNVFENGKPGGNSSKLHSAVHTEGAAQYNRIDHNEVLKWQRRAIRNTKVRSGTKGNRFDHNYLHDLRGPWGNSGEAFQVGTGPGEHSFTPETIIEYNLVDGHELEGEVVSLKAMGNTVQGNTFMNAPKGNVTTRVSSNNKLINNTLINLMSMRIYADNNEAIGNEFINTDFEVRSGDCLVPELLVKNSQYKGGHPAARNTLVVGNQFLNSNIILGKKGTGNKSFDRTFPAENTLLIANKGAEVVVRGSVKGIKNRTSYSGEIGKPIWMEPSQVGPKAADPVCDGGEPPVMLLPPNDLKMVIARP